jgi:uncharacterized membrane protein YozB (DUF420 family)
VSQTVTVTLDETDLYAAFRLIGQRNRKQSRPVLLAAVLLATIILLLLAMFPDARFAIFRSPLLAALSGIAIFLALALAVVIAALRPLLRRAARRTLTGHPGMSEQITYTIDDAAFGIRTVFSQASYPWDRLHGWREDARIVLVLLTRQLFYVVPKRQLLPTQLELLRERLQGTGSLNRQARP